MFFLTFIMLIIMLKLVLTLVLMLVLVLMSKCEPALRLPSFVSELLVYIKL